MADNMNVTVRDPLAPRRQMPPIVIGRAGEYGATTVTFDLRGFIDRYGAGVPTLLHKRPPDDEAYIVPTSAADTETHDRTEMPDSETLVWHVGQVATSYVGNGKIELQWHPDGAAKKSAQFDVVVLGTIGNPVSEIPDAQQIYLDVMQGIADDAEDAADRAEAAVEHYPQIRDGYWWVWDAESGKWVNTGVKATGEGGGNPNAVLYTQQSLTDAQKSQARTNVGAGTYSKPSGGIPKSDLAQAVQDALDATSSGLTEEVKQALLDCFENVAWINDDGQTYYDALYAALYPPKTLVSISAVFTQGSAVIYDMDSLDTLKQYLTVTATYDDTSTGAVTNYTLSGTLTEGTSTITVLYGGKTDTFTVTVTGNPYQLVEYVETDGASRIDTGVVFDGTKDIEVTLEMAFAGTLEMGESALNGWSAGGSVGVQLASGVQCWTDGASAPSASTHLSGIDIMTNVVMTIQSGSATNTVSVFSNTNGTKTLTRTHANVANRTFLPFPLFALSKQDSFDYLPSGFRIKSAIINVGGTVVRNMKACYRKSDNVIGFFDETNSVFYTNAGTGTFTKGGDIS